MISKFVRIFVASTLLIGFSLVATPSGADLADDIANLKKQQEQVREDKTEQAQTIDAATAEAEELAEVLNTLNEQVNAQQAKFDAVERLSQQTEQRRASALEASSETQERIDDLEDELAELAITGFRNRSAQSDLEVFSAQDPTKAVTMSRISKSIARSEVEAAEELKQSKAELEGLAAETNGATSELAELQAKLAADKAKLEAARDTQATVSNQAEARLEAELAEAAVLDERDKELADSIRIKNLPVAQQTQIANRSRPASAAPLPAVGAAPGTIVKVTNYAGQAIEVDSSIAANVQALLNASEAAGLRLGGWGYRSSQRQIELRIQNCGGNSNYAIYQKRSSTCRPPTARPGSSNHERGMAIDFTTGGSTIKSRNTSAFRWLAANAARYGLKNLPSEPWHWSVNGN